jgi:hypothetical protein
MPLLCITHGDNDDSMYHSDYADVPFIEVDARFQRYCTVFSRITVGTLEFGMADPRVTSAHSIRLYESNIGNCNLLSC